MAKEWPMVMESAESSALLSYAWSKAGLDAVKLGDIKKNKKNSHQTANKFRSITAFMFRSISPNTACAIETFRRRHRAATTSAHFGPSTKHLRHEKRLRFAEGDIYSNNGFVLRNAQIL
jgi:hypothetical protein